MTFTIQTARSRRSQVPPVVRTHSSRLSTSTTTPGLSTPHQISDRSPVDQQYEHEHLNYVERCGLRASPIFCENNPTQSVVEAFGGLAILGRP